MVILNKIYTKTGDKGSTSLGDGSRVSKDSLRVEASSSVFFSPPPALRTEGIVKEILVIL